MNESQYKVFHIPEMIHTAKCQEKCPDMNSVDIMIKPV